MARGRPKAPLYWDASALVSLFLPDRHSPAARALVRGRRSNLCSTLAHAETSAVLRRAERLEALPERAVAGALAFLAGPAFLWLETVPDRARVEALARRYPLRGADLWHLACALDARDVEPTLRLVTFDDALVRAAAAEGIAASAP